MPSLVGSEMCIRDRVMPESMACQKARLNAIYKELIDAMLPYQDQATGMWYQVVNRGGIAPNYLEESGSAIFAYAIMKSVRLHYLPQEYFKYGQKAFDGICSTYPVSYTHLRAHETRHDLVCRLLLEKKIQISDPTRQAEITYAVF